MDYADYFMCHVALGLKEPLDIYVGGYVFSEEKLGQLCIDAYGYTQERVELKGPFACASLYFASLTSLDSPSLIPIVYYRGKTQDIPRRGYLLT